MQAEETFRDAARDVVIEDFDGLFSAGLTPTQAIDYWACEVMGRTQSEQAEARGVRRESVRDSVHRARKELNNE